MVAMPKHSLEAKTCTPVDYGRVRKLLHQALGRAVKVLPMNVNTAWQQLNGTRDVSLRLVVETATVTGCSSAWEYLAQMFGALWVPRPAAESLGLDGALTLTAATGAEFGDVARLVPEILADGRVDAEEVALAEKELTDLQARAEALRLELRAMAK